jgi:hypothetical protein
MLDHPYLASAVARLPIKLVAERDWCKTMATDGYHIFINPAFCETLTDEDLMFVLAHELLHCVLGHIERGKDRLQGRWNESVDYATNQTLESFGLKTPKGGLLDERFAGKTAEDIYNMISREAPSEGARRVLGGHGRHDHRRRRRRLRSRWPIDQPRQHGERERGLRSRQHRQPRRGLRDVVGHGRQRGKRPREPVRNRLRPDGALRRHPQGTRRRLRRHRR